jgi:hypothetical protein
MNLSSPSSAPGREAPGIWESSHEVNSFPGFDLSVRLAVLGDIADPWRPEELSDGVSDVLSGMQSAAFHERPEAGPVCHGVLCDCGTMRPNGRHRVPVAKRMSAVTGPPEADEKSAS